jgi:hypothetical protein
MAFELEIVRTMQDVGAARALATSLLAREALDASDDAIDFLEKVAGWDGEAPLSRRQAEFLLAVRDDNRYVASLYDFDLARVLRECWSARADLEDEADATFLAGLRDRVAARGGKTFRVAEGRRLLRVARRIGGVLD